MTKNRRNLISVICVLLCMVLIVSAPVTVFGEPLHDTQAEVANDSAETNEPPLESGNGSSGTQEQEAMEEPAGEPEELPEPTQKAEPEANSIQGSGSLLGAGSVGLGWLKSGTLSSTVEVGLADSLQFSLVRDGSDEAVGYKIVAVYYNNDPGETESGFRVANSGKFIAGSPVDGNPSLVYDMAPGTVSAETSVTFEAAPQKVYPDEKLRVDVKLYRVVDGLDDELVESKTAYLDAFFKSAGLSNMVSMKSPVSITEGASTGLYEAGFAVVSMKTAGVETNGGVWAGYFGANYIGYDQVEVTLDFSKVSVTAGGNTHTYLEWQNPAVYGSYGFLAPPVTFYRDDQGLDPVEEDSPALTYTQSGTKKSADYNPGYHPFYFKTTEDFSGENTSIDFQDMEILRTMEINGKRYTFAPDKGTAAEFTDFNDRGVPLINVNIPSSMIIKPVTSDEASVVMRRAVADGSAGYLQYNSAQYVGTGAKTEHLYYQELFKTEIILPGMKGDVELTFNIPANTKVTHLRIPGTNGNNQYDSVTVNGVTKMAPQDKNYDTINVQGHNFGEPLIVTVNGIQAIKSASGRPVEYPKNLLQFAGVTNDNMAVGSMATFTLASAVNGNGEPVNLKGTLSAKAVVADDYWVDVYTDGTTLAFAQPNSTQNPVSSIEKGEQFYLTMQFYPSHYPYSATLRSDGNDPLNTTLLPNPVVYFLLPDGMEADLDNIQLFKNTTGGRGFKLLGDDPANLQYTAKSLGKNSGGKEVIEVKIHGESGADVWIEGHYASRLRVSVPVNMPPEASASYIEMTANDVFVGTWGDKAARVYMSGAGGATVNTSGVLPEGAILNGSYAVRSNNSRTTSIDLTASKNAQVYAAVRTDAQRDRYQSYNSNVADSFPQIRAGSRSEQFLVQLYNGMGSNLTDAQAYFILPARNNHSDEKWRTMLTGQPVFTAGAGTSYEVYYTTQDLLWEKSAWTLDELKTLGTWTKVNGHIPDGDLGKVTAFRYEFKTLGDKEQFRMTAQFGVPVVVENTKPEYGSTAIGQMLFDFGGEMKGERANTAAVKLRKSDAPILAAPEGMGEKPIEQETTVAMLEEGNIPVWDSVIAYDDFTELAIDSVKVEFTPADGQKTTVAEFSGSGDFQNSGYNAPGMVPGLDIGYAQGTRSSIDFGIKQALDYVNASKAGTYVITYTTQRDGDAQATSVTRTIHIERPENTLQKTDAELELFMGEAFPDSFTGWQEYLRSLVSITDGGIEISGADARLNGFDANVPGTYQVTFTYVNSYDYSVTATVKAVVKYKGTVSGTVSSNGKNIEGAVLYATGLETGSATTDENGAYRFEIRATKDEPASKGYTLLLDHAALPDGVKNPDAAFVGSNGTGNAANPNPVHDFVLEPIKIAVEFDNGAAYRSHDIGLYVDGAQIMTQPVGEAGKYRFSPENGEGWFAADAGDYQVKVRPGEGMADDIENLGDDFGADSNGFSSNTLTLAASDIHLRAQAQLPAGEAGGNKPENPVNPGNPEKPAAGSDGTQSGTDDVEAGTDHVRQPDEKTNSASKPAGKEAVQAIGDSEVPAIGGSENSMPLHGVAKVPTWSLLNLILMIAGAALSIVLALRIFLKKRKQQEEQSGKKRWIYKLIGILAGIALVVLFLATQDMSALMALLDAWSWLFAVLLALQAVMAWFGLRKKQKNEDNAV